MWDTGNLLCLLILFSNKYLSTHLDKDCFLHSKILVKKIKMVEYQNKKTYALNNIDNDKLNELSEFPIGSVTKLFTIISLLLLHQNKK